MGVTELAQALRTSVSELSSRPQLVWVPESLYAMCYIGSVFQSMTLGTPYIKTTRGTCQTKDVSKSGDGDQKSVHSTRAQGNSHACQSLRSTAWALLLSLLGVNWFIPWQRYESRNLCNGYVFLIQLNRDTQLCSSYRHFLPSEDEWPSGFPGPAEGRRGQSSWTTLEVVALQMLLPSLTLEARPRKALKQVSARFWEARSHCADLQRACLLSESGMLYVLMKTQSARRLEKPDPLPSQTKALTWHCWDARKKKNDINWTHLT